MPRDVEARRRGTSVSGFELIHAGGFRPGGRLGQVIDIAVGFATDYALVVTLEQAGRQARITFRNPLSFRVQDECDLLDHWCVRACEGVPVGLLYTLRHSPYRDEFVQTISGQTETVTHYLIAADDLCVEVMSALRPELPDGW